MVVQLRDLEVKSVFVQDEFTVSCPEWKPRKYDNRPDPVVVGGGPLDLPERIDQCCHVQMSDHLQKYERCFNQTHEVDGKHGWLCRKHLDAQQTAYEVQTVDSLQKKGIDRNNEWNMEPLKERMTEEVISCRRSHGSKFPQIAAKQEGRPQPGPAIDYQDYLQWGWAAKSNQFEMDPDYEMVPEDELRSRL